MFQISNEVEQFYVQKGLIGGEDCGKILVHVDVCICRWKRILGCDGY